ncbi:MAG: LpxD N-terminal domain-containing protein [Gemmatimonadales bacterium]
MSPLTAGAVAALVGGEIEGSPEVQVTGVAALDAARPGDLTFLAEPRWVSYLAATRAAAVLIAPRLRRETGGPTTRIVVDDPRRAARIVAGHLRPATVWGIHASAVLGRCVRWQGRIAIGAMATLGHDVRLGAECVVGAGAYIGDRVTLGSACVIGPGARVGIDGFSHLAGPEGPEDLPHRGELTIGDRVSIGTLATIASGTMGPTVIGSGTKLDAQVHIGHHVRIGARCLIMAQAGIAGSTVLGDDVVVAGQAGLADGVRVGDGARIAAQSGVIGDIASGATVSGYPARDHRQVLRHAAALARLAPHARTLEHLASTTHGTSD